MKGKNENGRVASLEVFPFTLISCLILKHTCIAPVSIAVSNPIAIVRVSFSNTSNTGSAVALQTWTALSKVA